MPYETRAQETSTQEFGASVNRGGIQRADHEDGKTTRRKGVYGKAFLTVEVLEISASGPSDNLPAL
jgi:hypothetical protein